MTVHDGDHELDALLRAADPWPPERTVDPAIPQRALALVEKELTVSDTSPASKQPRGRLALIALVVAALAVTAGLVGTRLTDGGDSTAATPGRPVGDAMASCLQFTEETLALAPIAFDGTVSDIADDGTITFQVERWYRGGEGDTVTARASTLIEGAPELNGGVGFVDGGRYLVSGDRQDGTLVPAICGFTVEYDDAMAERWASAFA